ncbi:recombinase [Clostridium sp. WILCCON 0269]|uniref:Recombinase n=1 Tax=Candidatus Clostridium eludens TaxID=3381663 RepID=A0ABW8SRG4_9CLOT
MFVEVFNAMVENKECFIRKWKESFKKSDLLPKYKASQFIEIIGDAKPIVEFDINLYFRIIEKMTVFEGVKIIVTLLDGTNVECEIE